MLRAAGEGPAWLSWEAEEQRGAPHLLWAGVLWGSPPPLPSIPPDGMPNSSGMAHPMSIPPHGMTKPIEAPLKSIWHPTPPPYHKVCSQGGGGGTLLPEMLHLNCTPCDTGSLILGAPVAHLEGGSIQVFWQ